MYVCLYLYTLIIHAASYDFSQSIIRDDKKKTGGCRSEDISLPYAVAISGTSMHRFESSSLQLFKIFFFFCAALILVLGYLVMLMIRLVNATSTHTYKTY